MILAEKGMPDSKDIDGLKTTQYWRFFIGFPLVFFVFALLLLSFIVKHEPPKFLISSGRDDDALKSISSSYHKDENREEVLAFLKSTITEVQDSTTPKQVLCDRRYSTVVYVLIVGVTAATLNGAQFFAFYGQVILQKIFGNDTSDWVNDRVGLDMMNIVEFFAQFIAMFIIKRFRRRTIFLTYGVLMACLNALLGFSDIARTSAASMIVFLSMIFTWECFGQPIMQIYAVEVTTNAATGVIAVYQNLLMFVAGIVIRYMVNYMAIWVLFFTTAVITGLYTVFSFFVLKETSHLTNKEKKSVYSPSAKLELQR